ncbi:MAG: DDE-type integrase/transposase/recombinase [Rhodobacteraceae bacterium]|nr:DDE-type integrase/transposase/recombinase [Paracoccaceae bacterium]
MSAPDYANCQPKDSSCEKGDVHTCRKLSWGPQNLGKNLAGGRYRCKLTESSRSIKELTSKSEANGCIRWLIDECAAIIGKLYRAVDRDGNSLDFMLSERRNTAAATQFFAKTLACSGIPLRIVIDKGGANGTGINEVNKTLGRFGCPTKIPTIRSKYLSNRIEQNHPLSGT